MTYIINRLTEPSSWIGAAFAAALIVIAMVVPNENARTLLVLLAIAGGVAGIFLPEGIARLRGRG